MEGRLMTSPPLFLLNNSLLVGQRLFITEVLANICAIVLSQCNASNIYGERCGLLDGTSSCDVIRNVNVLHLVQGCSKACGAHTPVSQPITGEGFNFYFLYSFGFSALILI